MGKVRYQGMVAFKQRGLPGWGRGASRTGLMGFHMVMVCRGVGKSKEMTYQAMVAPEHKGRRENGMCREEVTYTAKVAFRQRGPIGGRPETRL